MKCSCYLQRILFLFILIDFSHNQLICQKAIHFDSPGEYLEVKHHNELSPTVFTIEFWLRITELGDPEAAMGEMTILDKRGNDTGYNIRLAGTSFPLPVFAFYQDGGTNTGDGIHRNTWHHIAVVQTNAKLSMYLDGELAGTSINSNYTGNTTAPLRIGEFLGYPGWYLGLRGNLDDLRFWSVARTSAEIKENMHTKYSGTEDNMVALWDFDRKFGNQIRNQTANRHHAQVIGSATLIDSDAPVGFVPPSPLKSCRIVGEEDHIRIEWEPVSSPSTVHIYRSQNWDFEPNKSNLLASVEMDKGYYLDNQIKSNRLYGYRTRIENEENHFSQSSILGVGKTKSLVKDYWTGVYYYPWYGAAQGGHNWNGTYIRDRLIPRQPPMLGHYSSRKASVVRQHLDWMTAYGVDFLVSSWWGRNSWENATLANVMLSEIEKSDIKFSLYYESALHGFDDGINITTTERNEILKNFTFMAINYFNHPNYLKIEGRPVVFLYLSGIYRGQYKQTFQEVRQVIENLGYNIYLIGDEMGWDPPNANHMDFLDAISPYIMFGQERHDGYPSNTNYFNELTTSIKGWQDVAGPAGIKIIPNVFPGFNNRNFSQDVYAQPRKTAPERNSQSFLSDYIRVVRPFTDPELNMVMITSWNEWHEDTQIEPVILSPPTAKDKSATGKDQTQEYIYEGYGFKNLETVRTLLSDQSCNLSASIDFSPILCPGSSNGFVHLDVRGAVHPMIIEWSTGDSSLSQEFLSPGLYTATISDGAGCSDNVEIDIKVASEIDVHIDTILHIVNGTSGKIKVSIKGGIPPYNYSWYLNDILISSDSIPEILNSGSYRLIITDQLHCTIILDSLTVNMTTAVKGLSKEQLRIFPNPSSDIIYIESSILPSAFTLINIYRTTGVLVATISSFQNLIDISGIPSGVYVFELVTDEGKWSQKLIKL